MKFRHGLLIGFGIGFVVGARAGRERYEQMAEMVRNAAGEERVDDWTRKGRAAYDATSEKTRSAMSTGLETASRTVRRVAETPPAEAETSDPTESGNSQTSG